MLKLQIIFLNSVLLLNGCNFSKEETEAALDEKVEAALELAVQQTTFMAKYLMDKPDQLPTTMDEEGSILSSEPSWWTSGFFPGTLWLLYEHTSDSALLEFADNYTRRLEREDYSGWDHDIGFQIYCSYGKAFRITNDKYYRQILNIAANDLAERFDSTVGCILSWNKAAWNRQWQFPVIVDNMMNLELLMWSAEELDKLEMKYIAESHAETTLENHFREDNSSYHVVSYDTISGLPELKHTAQGYNHESAWARGQAWGLYGYTMMYRESGNEKYLKHAESIADFIIHHQNLPEDKIPYWDFNASDIPNELRDASAGAIMASALLELSKLSSGVKSAEYFDVATKQLSTLCSEEYLAEVGENGFFILKHSVGHMPNKTEIDVPLSYADYYFVESLVRYKKILKQ